MKTIIASLKAKIEATKQEITSLEKSIERLHLVHSATAIDEDKEDIEGKIEYSESALWGLEGKLVCLRTALGNTLEAAGADHFDIDWDQPEVNC